MSIKQLHDALQRINHNHITVTCHILLHSRQPLLPSHILRKKLRKLSKFSVFPSTRHHYICLMHNLLFTTCNSPMSGRLSYAVIVLKQLNESSWFLSRRPFSAYHALCVIMEFVYLQNKDTSSWNLIQNRNFANFSVFFATAHLLPQVLST